jgi:glyoxylase-like metal-dependent hydrolase (beta-lactamase superfamily II)
MIGVRLLVDSMFTTDRTTFLPEGPKVPYQAASKSLLITSGKERILVDTGLGEIPSHAPLRKKVIVERRDGQGIKTQLARYGIKPAQITTVVNTHLHAAHAGNNNLFKHAKFYIAGEEFRYIDKQLAEDPSQTAYIPETYDKVRDVTQTNGEFELIDGVRVVPTPGHTAGHQSVLIEQKASTIVYCGDVSPLKDNLINHVPMYGYDRKLILKSMDHLLQTTRARWLFAHDGAQLTTRQAFKPSQHPPGFFSARPTVLSGSDGSVY